MHQRKSVALLGIIWITALMRCDSVPTVAGPTRPDSAIAKTTSLPATSENTIPMEKTDCDKAKQMILDGDFREWKGLPADCDWTAWTGPLPTDWEEVMRRPLGTSFRKGYQLFFELEHYEHPSLSFADGKPILFESRGPELVAFDSLLLALRKPKAKLDWDYGTLPLPKCEYVYPERGITLFMNLEGGSALHIALYAATTLADYQANLRPGFKKTLRPKR